MSIRKGSKVRIKSYNEISKTLVPFADKTVDGYRHQDSGLVYLPGDFIDEIGKEFIVSNVDEDGDYELKGSYNFYHADWIEKV